jgi:IPT/TIG domain-containing protein
VRPTLSFSPLVASIAISLLTFSICARAQSPQISNVTPTSGVAGTQVTISGSGFGATQGSGNVWLGSNFGVVSSWSDAQVVATVASGSKTGTAAILQGGVWSNTVNLTVVTPTITSVTPTSGVAGTHVTISGSGFGAAQGSGNVWLGSNFGVVSSWSDAQVVATVAPGSQTGTAAILQGGVWSNSVNLTVVTPTITSVTPTSGAAGTQVAIAGSGFGASQGSGNVWLGSNFGLVVSWSDAQVVATVASGSQTGRLRFCRAEFGRTA